MQDTEITEFPAKARSGILGYLIFLGSWLFFAASVYGFIWGGIALDAGHSYGAWGIVGAVVALMVSIVAWASLVIVVPGMTSVRQFFGRYIGTVRQPGLSVVTPFSSGKKVSIRVHNFETNELKVNDSDGNPVNIAAIVVWRVADTAKANYAVEDFTEFVHTQSEAALRHVASTHPYDEPGPGETSLRGGTEMVSAELAHEVAERITVAGLEVIEVRISSLAYAPEIAQAMLRRQQASAIIAAREQIVEGSVTMVQQALARLESEDIVEMDDERRAHMVSNLLVVLCSEQPSTPIVNAGTLYG